MYGLAEIAQNLLMKSMILQNWSHFIRSQCSGLTTFFSKSLFGDLKIKWFLDKILVARKEKQNKK